MKRNKGAEIFFLYITKSNWVINFYMLNKILDLSIYITNSTGIIQTFLKAHIYINSFLLFPWKPIIVPIHIDPMLMYVTHQ